MIRILHAMAGARVGGAEEFFSRLLPALAQTGVSQTAAIRTNGKRERILKDAGIPFEIHRFGGIFDWTTRRRFKRQADKYAPDVIFAWMSRAAKFCTPGKYLIIGRLGGYYNLKYYNKCDHLVANTEHICQYIAGLGWPESQIHYLPNFVDGTPGEAIDRSMMNTPSDAPLLLALGRLHSNKAFDVLLEALVSVPRAYLWIAGEGPEQLALKNLAKQLDISDRVKFLGWRSDTNNLLASCDLLVCSSRVEPLGNVVLEAWAQKKPVVATEATGPKALIQTGLNGLLTPLNDASALSTSIQSVLSSEDHATALAEQGFRTYNEKFTEERVTSLYRNFFAVVTR